MNKNQNTKEKICAFFASDYHFEMISLPYIEKSLEKNKQIIILTENNLENTIKTLVSNINLKEERKKEILNLDWKNNDLVKFKKIKEKTKNEKEIIVFIKGRKNYIKNINENIENWATNARNLTVIDCYDIEEIGEDTDQVIEGYKKVLSTSGVKEIQKL